MQRFLLALLLLAPQVAAAQDRSAAALGELVSGIGVNTRVLVIAAHPDDEDTQFISWLARGRHVETAYLSLTRGDGGQNLIGNELGEALGVIRTEELLAARRIDGGHQFFTRAFDFGFSKNAEETFTQWPRDSVLRDIVTVVRAFRPHIIVSIWSGTPRDGHGHHQASGILAKDAFDLAGDSVRFPASSTAGHAAWTPLKFYRGSFFNRDSSTITFNAGEFSPLRGRSFVEIAAQSRSQHRSQGQGGIERKGVVMDGLRRFDTRVNASDDPRRERSIFDGIDTTWSRFARDNPRVRSTLDSLPAAFAAARASLDLFEPSRVIGPLARVRRLLNEIARGTGGSCQEDGPVCTGFSPDLADSLVEAMRRTNDALALAAGVAVEATASREVWAVGETIPVSIAVYNRGRAPIEVVGTSVVMQDYRAAPNSPSATRPSATARTIAPDSTWRDSTTGVFHTPTSPWWLELPRRGAMFTPPIHGEMEDRRPADAQTTITLRASSATFTVTTPIVYRFADAVKGEIERPIAGAPAVSVTLEHDVEYAPANTSLDRTVRVQLRSASSVAQAVRISLSVPTGVIVDSATRVVELPPLGAQRSASFAIRGQLPAGRHTITATAQIGAQAFAEGYTPIEHDHIRPQRMYRASRLDVEAVDVKLPRGAVVAYVPGVGDNVAPMLEQLGLQVTVLDPATLPNTDLARFSAVVVGTRAYEASPQLVANNVHLLDYARKGGTLVVQYGQYEMQQPGMMPFPITLTRPADRVTVENAPVRVLDPAAPVLNVPNRITSSDFTGWVQDRSLYMPRTFDSHYAAPLSTNDPGEQANNGAILVAPFGKGVYVYTTLAFFRQLPAGVPGAARLFVNLLSAKPPATAQ